VRSLTSRPSAPGRGSSSRCTKSIHWCAPGVVEECGSSPVIEQPAVIEKILTHLGLWPAHAHSPPAQSLAA
jgi:hypothetical protein